MIATSRAIVLRTIKYSDVSLIVDTFTEHHGRRSFIVRIPKTRKASVKNVLFAPMALLNIEWNEHGSTKLPRIKSVQPLHIYYSIPFSPPKMAITMFLAEVLTGTLRAPMPDHKVFEFIYTSMEWLDAEERNCANFHLVFLLHLTKLLGFFPNYESFNKDKYFDMENGCFSATLPATPNFLKPDEAKYLPMLLGMKYPTASRFHFTRAQRVRIINIIIKYYSLHLPSFPELKSPEILHEMLV